jgi:hypothetical protein
MECMWSVKNPGGLATDVSQLSFRFWPLNSRIPASNGRSTDPPTQRSIEWFRIEVTSQGTGAHPGIFG